MIRSPGFDLDKLIKQQSIQTCFQPIVSVRKKKIIGIEALSRGINPDSGELISPFVLFSAAEKFDKLVEVDRACRERAFANFSNLHKKYPDLLLFVNFDTSMVDKGIVGSGNFMQMIKKYSLNPSNIVIELVESRVKDFTELCKFIKTYRDNGFSLALDDFGAGHSNLERISIIKPEIIKIDRSLIKDVHTEFYKQEILKAIIKLTDQLGVMVLSEGVETYHEVMKTLELDTDLLQGYFFSKPQPNSALSFDETQEKIDVAADDFFKCVIKRIKKRKERFSNFQMVIFSILSSLREHGIDSMEDELQKMIADFSIVECAYVLNESGRQASRTILNNGHLHGQKSSFLFKPAESGDDHSLKDYFVYIQAGLDKFITDPYISLATGSLCRTISMTYADKDKRKLILCLDMKEDI
ncbi:EAL domain-containing protein [Desulfonatronovibrio magnus]|uniref:EAL domain-containing protein n=1 Tax=Desulfonatronovibrio magnus TaxID=698827 RepID=UPI0005EB30E8|nr:EAL domain-containing protein [Desulfonatronovibrio magnus]